MPEQDKAKPEWQDWPEEPWASMPLTPEAFKRTYACVNAMAGKPDPERWVAAVAALERAARAAKCQSGLPGYVQGMLEKSLAALDSAAGGEGGG